MTVGAVGVATRAPATSELPRPRWRDLDGLRGLACLGVVTYHVLIASADGAAARTGVLHRLVAGMDGFVDLFFVLSAFLLSAPLLQALLDDVEPPSRRVLLVRRAVRIVPAYAVAVVVVWSFRNPVLPGDLADLVEHLLFLQTFDRERIFYTIGPAWSLAVEMHFVLLLAVAATGWAVLCRGRDRRWRLRLLWLSVLGTAALGVSWRVVAAVTGVAATDWPVWFSLPAKLDVFAVGVGLGLLRATGVRCPGTTAVGLRAAGVALVLGACLVRPATGGPVWFHLAVALGWGLLVSGTVLAGTVRSHTVPAGRAWDRVLGHPLLVAVGAVSYGAYLWHEPLQLALPSVLPGAGAAVTLALVVVLSLAAGWVSRVLVERPTRSAAELFAVRGGHRDYYDGS